MKGVKIVITYEDGTEKTLIDWRDRETEVEVTHGRRESKQLFLLQCVHTLEETEVKTNLAAQAAFAKAQMNKQKGEL